MAKCIGSTSVHQLGISTCSQQHFDQVHVPIIGRVHESAVISRWLLIVDILSVADCIHHIFDPAMSSCVHKVFINCNQSCCAY